MSENGASDGARTKIFYHYKSITYIYFHQFVPSYVPIFVPMFFSFKIDSILANNNQSRKSGLAS